MCLQVEYISINLWEGKEEKKHAVLNKSSVELLTYSEMVRNSSAAQVFPTVVMATPAMLIKTAISFATFMESCPSRAPMKSVKSPDVEFRTVVLATLVFARAEFDKYCIALKAWISHILRKGKMKNHFP